MPTGPAPTASTAEAIGKTLAEGGAPADVLR
jgi:hypothetical protein